MIDVDAVSLPAFAIADRLEPSRLSAWHVHRKHQLLYAASGAMQFELREAQWTLPPQRAAFIPAGVEHRVRVAAPGDLKTVYFAHDTKGEACVFGVSSLAREMLLTSTRWGPNLRALPAVATAFFEALVRLAEEWRREETPFRLPRARTPELERAMRYALQNLGRTPSVEDAARASGLSTRTLERRFSEEAGMSWRKFVQTARMLRALELLPGSRVTDVAIALGFESFGAFSTAFQRFTGETPSAYRKRATSSASP